MNSEDDKSVTSDKFVTQAMENILTPDSSNEVSSIDQYNTPSNVCHHTDQINLCYNTNLLKKTDNLLLSSNSTNMCYKGGENDLYDVFKNDLSDESPCLKVEFSKTMDQIIVEKETFNQLQKRFSQLQKHCIELEIEIQHKEECLQNCKPCLNPEFPDLNEYFLINNLKTQLQDKNSTINSLKNQIKMYEQRNDAKWKHDTYETNCKMAKLRVKMRLLK
jgi:archaellum component FlaC